MSKIKVMPLSKSGPERTRSVADDVFETVEAIVASGGGRVLFGDAGDRSPVLSSLLRFAERSHPGLIFDRVGDETGLYVEGRRAACSGVEA